MIRVTIVCFECKQIVDATVYAKKGRAVAAAFEEQHISESCLKEEPEPDGEDEAKPAAGQAEAAEVGPVPGSPTRTH